MDNEQLIKQCFEQHNNSFNGEIKFTFEEYRNFWLNHKPNKKYKMVNRDKSEVECEVVYYPMPTYKDLRACIAIDNKDFREVPVCFLK